MLIKCVDFLATVLTSANCFPCSMMKSLDVYADILI
jgi:hypothetical protein